MNSGSPGFAKLFNYLLSLLNEEEFLKRQLCQVMLMTCYRSSS
jgi:hypothetical protein